ncbi:MAG: hypothetical protein Hyperionvirus2_217 [Hyperionvirus sp.]|uniref:Uncharacterized protein n=1 Tax=Hyperionvirus sp. TaxID=2487770 RepID=A0A3G5AC31_9VIRU|nr:MAG: hypothetical protein Hyperionvirus2_217 [Hyperionvirus sp.]
MAFVDSKCQVPDCNAPREQYMADQKTRDFVRCKGPKHIQPFCEKHLPKCACGNWRFIKPSAPTELKYPLSEADSAFFSRRCAKCIITCSIPDCKGIRFGTKNKVSSFCEPHESEFVVTGYKKFEQLVQDAASIRTHPGFQTFEKQIMFPGRHTFEEYFSACTSLFTAAASSANPTIWKNFFSEADYLHKCSAVLS